MASGDIVAIIGAPTPPATLYATHDIRVGGSTPAESYPVLDFNDSTDSYMDFPIRMHGYAGGGVTVEWDWSASSATTGVTRWGAAFRRIADDAEDIDTSHTYDFNENDDTTASASGECSRNSIAFTNGADMDSIANGEAGILRIFRNADHANDNMSGDAEAWYETLTIREA